ncbi:hypothetical protein [Cellulomonas taurus]|uniref:hypothetical protein n=1 Tax=Cellulomonas taurus TaxID=2729175 RepID=UPI00145CFEFF|nr:hypothetical protein [Cellulomonas taurus]
MELDNDVAVVIVDEVSEQLGVQLRDRLAAYCFGSANVADDADYYSFERTIKELLVRYDTKPHETKIGMAGELLVHVLVPHTHPNMSSSAVFLNKEERSIKKGFDLTFHATADGSVWYGEVKSGVVKGTQLADEKSVDLLKTAAADIADKLGKGAQRSRWDSAVADAVLTLEASQAASAKKLLRNDATEAAAGKLKNKNVLVAAVVMHEIGHCEISGAHVRQAVSSLNSTGRFSSVAVLVAQQHEIETLLDHLREAGASV